MVGGSTQPEPLRVVVVVRPPVFTRHAHETHTDQFPAVFHPSKDTSFVVVTGGAEDAGGTVHSPTVPDFLDPIACQSLEGRRHVEQRYF